eukprot:m.311691 g.311691  ORF g.311691 m.311691 type:complete len:55 (+) comp112582_c0_seq1:65-229(+)
MTKQPTVTLLFLSRSCLGPTSIKTEDQPLKDHEEFTEKSDKYTYAPAAGYPKDL